MSLKQDLVSNAVISYLPWITFILQAILVVPAIIKFSDVEVLGIWFLGNSILGYSSFFVTSLIQTISRLLSSSQSKQDSERSLAKHFGASCFICFLISLLPSSGTMVLAFFSDKAFNFTLQYPSEIKYFFLCLSVCFLFIFFTIPFVSYIFSINKTRYRFIIETIVSLLTIGAILLALRFHKGILTLGLIKLAAVAFDLLLMITVFYVTKPRNFKLRINTDIRILHDYWNYNTSLIIISVAGLIQFQSATLIAAVFLDAYAVSAFGIALKLFQFTSNLPLQFSQPVFAASNYFAHSHEKQKLRSLFLFGTKASAIILFLLLIPFSILGRDIIMLWVGIDFVDISYGIFLVLISHLPVNINHNIAVQILKGEGEVRVITKFSLFRAVANLCITLITIQYFGVYGLAIGITIPFYIFGWPYSKYIFEHYKMTFRDYSKNLIIPVYVPALILFCLVLISYLALGSVQSWIYLAPYWLCSMLVFAGLLFLFPINRSDFLRIITNRHGS